MIAISLRRLVDVCINVVLICLLALVLGSRGAEAALPMVSEVSLFRIEDAVNVNGRLGADIEPLDREIGCDSLP
jgi:hypothetical protein